MSDKKAPNLNEIIEHAENHITSALQQINEPCLCQLGDLCSVGMLQLALAGKMSRDQQVVATGNMVSCINELENMKANLQELFGSLPVEVQIIMAAEMAKRSIGMQVGLIHREGRSVH